MKKTIQDIILMIDQVSEDAVVYAERIEGKFQPWSHAEVLELSEEEQTLHTPEIARLKCPGLDYFLEVFLIKELLEDRLTTDSEILVERVIHYAKFDA